MTFDIIVPAFIAGLLTFIAPCTFPLIPGYLSFISGVPLSELKSGNQVKALRFKIFLNGFFYVFGFSLVFVILGSLFGLGGATLIKYRFWLSRLGGVFSIFFGLYILGISRFKIFDFLNREHHLPLFKFIKPGSPQSSFLFGATFAFGWTPCVGPILGSILLLASSEATVLAGAILLGVFSLGLAVPFLVMASAIDYFAQRLAALAPLLKIVSILGGLLLIFLGFLLLTNKFAFWLSWAYRIFEFINYDRLLDYL
jgi:cytochrome c-type biogenesis protein